MSESMWKNTLLEAKNALQHGQVIALPTDTVYGLGISPLHCESPEVLYSLKHREAHKPIAWLIADVDDLALYGTDIPPYALELARKFWPGALTLVVKASPRVPSAYQSEAGSIGLRVPAHDDTRELIRVLGSPLAVTSANLSGEQAAFSLASLDPRLQERIAFALPEEGVALSGVASTVVDCTCDQPRILRQGDIQIPC